MEKIFAGVLVCAALVFAGSSHAQTASAIPPLSATQPVPAELAQMVADFNAAIASKDLDRIESFYSERYLHDGRNKKMHRPYVAGWINNIPGFTLKLTSFRPVSADRAYITADIHIGMLTNQKYLDYQVSRDNGEWKWLGNQQP